MLLIVFLFMWRCCFDTLAWSSITVDCWSAWSGEAGWPVLGSKHSLHDFSTGFYPFIISPSHVLIPSLDFMARLNRNGQRGTGSKIFYVQGSVLKLVCQVVQSSRATLGHWDCCLDTKQWLSHAFKEHSGFAQNANATVKVRTVKFGMLFQKGDIVSLLWCLLARQVASLKSITTLKWK